MFKKKIFWQSWVFRGICSTQLFIASCILTSFFNKVIAQPTTTYHGSKKDSISLGKIENSLAPLYSIKGNDFCKSIPQVMKEDNIHGLSMVFIDKGELAWSKCYGYSCLEDSILVNSETVFLAASLSKPISSIASLNLVENGFLDLYSDINDKFKNWRIPESEFTKQKKVTLEGLISHTSGIANQVYKGYKPDELIPTVEQLLDGKNPSKDLPITLEYKPGERRKYSNPGYLVLQKLMTDVTGQPFPELIDSIIFQPCKMYSSTFKQPIPDRLFSRRAIGYTKVGTAVPYQIYPFMAPAAMWTTPADIGKFIITLLKDHDGGTSTLLSKDMLNEVFKKSDKRLSFQKFHWKKDVLFKHTGSNDGFTCFMLGSIDNNQGLVVMTNSENSWRLFDFIIRAVAEEYKWEYFRKEVYDELPLHKKDLEQYTGVFKSTNDTLHVSGKNGKLLLKDLEKNSSSILTHIDNDEFLLPAKQLKLIFLRKNGGKIEGVKVVDEFGESSVAVKIE